MINMIKLFENAELNVNVRAMEVNGDVWFVGKDIAEALGYTKPENALATHVRDKFKTTTLIQGNGSNYKSKVTIINEAGMYALVMKSKLPMAEKFQDWVLEDILPSIRKHGAYMTENTLEQALTSPDFLIQLATKLKDEQTKRIEAERTIKEQKPKVLFAESVQASKKCILIRDFAKAVKQNGIDLGEKRLFAWLRDNGYLTKNNMPTQKAMNLCLFEVSQTIITCSNGEVKTNFTPKLTGKGQIYFINKFLNKNF